MALCLSPQSSQGGGNRTLLYGHAILLRHYHSAMVSASLYRLLSPSILLLLTSLLLLQYAAPTDLDILIKCEKNIQIYLISQWWFNCMFSNNVFFSPSVKLQYLSCLTTSRSLTDKLAFDVGLQEDSTGTIPPHLRNTLYLDKRFKSEGLIIFCR